ncbi:hypothetical protein AB0C12_03725 [Actinoplanes sp. NPDC048967]|uniref:hypothetical protein n=1 Tax=Actinoplanes sp. NPDC048967 TaxID=3155269 RepID=UPI00340F3C38
MVSGHAYPWDVLGDPDFAGRAAEAVDAVTLAATYHSVRAATPLHPARRVVDARYAALYRPIRAAAWDGRLLRAAGPAWMTEQDPFGTAASTLRAAGLAVNAWIVLTHNTRLGLAHPETAVVNCFGERYPYALCPAHPEVRAYAATLAGEAVRDVAVDGISLEACGQLGLVHLGHHEKTDGAWTAAEVRLLSVCCCASCRSGWRAAGLVPDSVVAGLRAGSMSDDVMAAVLANRHANADALRAEVLGAVRERAPGVPITLHANPDPWATGPSPGLTPSAATDVDALLVPAWPTTEASAEVVRQAAATGLPVDAYVTVLPPVEADAVPGHVARLRAAGAARISLYHLGLAGPDRQKLLRIAAAATLG